MKKIVVLCLLCLLAYALHAENKCAVVSEVELKNNVIEFNKKNKVLPPFWKDSVFSVKTNSRCYSILVERSVILTEHGYKQRSYFFNRKKQFLYMIDNGHRSFVCEKTKRKKFLDKEDDYLIRYVENLRKKDKSLPGKFSPNLTVSILKGECSFELVEAAIGPGTDRLRRKWLFDYNGELIEVGEVISTNQRKKEAEEMLKQLESM